MSHPRIVVILSGKRKSGKDFLASKVIQKSQAAGLNIQLVRVSGPLKRAYATEHGLDYERLLDSSDYKEVHRAAMVVWGEERRARDAGFFCRLAVEEASSEQSTDPSNPPQHLILLVTDARRPSDLHYFIDNFSRAHCLLVRVEASEDARISRGWIHTPGVDDAATECGLDCWSDWDVKVDNSVSSGSAGDVFMIAIKTKIRDLR